MFGGLKQASIGRAFMVGFGNHDKYLEYNMARPLDENGWLAESAHELHIYQ